MSTESHPSPTGSSSSSQYGGGGNSAGANETISQPSPAKPTWAQILNSTPNNSSTTTNNPQISSSPSSQHAATTGNAGAASKKNISPSTTNLRPSNVNPHDQQQQQQQQHSTASSQMNNWSLNFNASSSTWMMDDETQRNSNSSQQSIDNDHNTHAGNTAEGFDRLESSSPTSEWNKPVLPNNSNANGWSNFGQQQQQKNPSRSNPTNNQWTDINNFYGTTTSTGNFSSHGNDPSNTWQDPSTSSSDVLPSTSNNSVMSKHKGASSNASSISAVLKSNFSLTTTTTSAGTIGSGAGGTPATTNTENLPVNSSEATISAALQPKYIEQLGWDEPNIQVTRRPNFDDGTSIWGDPMEMANVPVKKWTNGSKSTTGNVINPVQQPGQSQSTPPPSTPTTATNQGLISKTVSAGGNPSSQMVLSGENWPKQQSPTLGQPASSSSLSWNDSSVVSSLDPTNLSLGTNPRNAPTNSWNSLPPHPSNSNSDEWFREGMVDTSSWGLQGPTHKAPFDPYEGAIDTSGWSVPGPGGSGGGNPAAAAAAGRMPGMSRPPFMDSYNTNEDPHHSRMLPYDTSSVNDSYRTNLEGKSPMMPPGNMMPLPSNSHQFVPRPGPIYPQSSSDNTLRPINPNGGIQTPPGAPIMPTGNIISPKMPTSSPVPTATNPSNAFPSSMPAHLSGNGNNPANGNNNGAVHAQIMQQFRLAVQAGLISQDLLNTKLPAFMLQLLQRLFELQQKFQQYSYQLSDLSKQKSFFPPNVFQNEYDNLSKAIAQKKQEMLAVQKEIQDAHNKLKQQQKPSGGSQSSNPSASQMMGGNPSVGVGPGSSSGQGNPDQSRLHRWTKQSNPESGARGGGGGMFPPPPGLTPKDWPNDVHDSNENWEQNSANPFTTLDDIDGPPPFIPGQLWTWKSPLANVEDDPHVTPSSFTMGPKGLPSPMGNLNVGGADSAFSNPHLMQGYPRHQQSNRSQWQQGPLHDQNAFAPPMNDWNKAQQQQQQQQQYRGGSKLPHPPFGGGYRPYQ